jgi:hypothetical protein
MEENKKTPQFFTGGDLLYIVLIIIISTILFRQCDAAKRAKTREKLANANIEALKDSVRYEKNKRGEEIAIKKALLADKKNLESLNAELAREVKELKVRPVTIQVVGGTIAADPIIIENEIIKYREGEYGLLWDYDTTYSEGNYRKFSGETSVNVDSCGVIESKGTKIKTDEIGLTLVTGLREKDGALEIYVNPKYPGMIINKIEGAIIDPQKSNVIKKYFPQKKWSIGPMIGVGVSVGYGVSGRPILGPAFNIGVGVTYGIFRF